MHLRVRLPSLLTLDANTVGRHRSFSNSPYVVLLLGMPTDVPSERSRSPTPSVQLVTNEDGSETCVRDSCQLAQTELAVAEEPTFVHESRWRRCTLM